ncbi:hypothetical protein T439DRAFT_351242 [Meredithblackwellia eburnea MCA 4105]
MSSRAQLLPWLQLADESWWLNKSNISICAHYSGLTAVNFGQLTVVLGRTRTNVRTPKFVPPLLRGFAENGLLVQVSSLDSLSCEILHQRLFTFSLPPSPPPSPSSGVFDLKLDIYFMSFPDDKHDNRTGTFSSLLERRQAARSAWLELQARGDLQIDPISNSIEHHEQTRNAHAPTELEVQAELRRAEDALTSEAARVDDGALSRAMREQNEVVQRIKSEGLALTQEAMASALTDMLATHGTAPSGYLVEGDQTLSEAPPRRAAHRRGGEGSNLSLGGNPRSSNNQFALAKHRVKTRDGIDVEARRARREHAGRLNRDDEVERQSSSNVFRPRSYLGYDSYGYH